MATKTFKLGEVARGGIITADVTKTQIAIIGKEWDYSQGSRRSSNQTKAKEWTRRTVNITDPSAFRTLDFFLNDLTTSYYSDQNLKWVKSKAPAFNDRW